MTDIEHIKPGQVAHLGKLYEHFGGKEKLLGMDADVAVRRGARAVKGAAKVAKDAVAHDAAPSGPTPLAAAPHINIAPDVAEARPAAPAVAPDAEPPAPILPADVPLPAGVPAVAENDRPYAGPSPLRMREALALTQEEKDAFVQMGKALKIVTAERQVDIQKFYQNVVSVFAPADQTEVLHTLAKAPPKLLRELFDEGDKLPAHEGSFGGCPDAERECVLFDYCDSKRHA